MEDASINPFPYLFFFFLAYLQSVNSYRMNVAGKLENLENHSGCADTSGATKQSDSHSARTGLKLSPLPCEPLQLFCGSQKAL